MNFMVSWKAGDRKACLSTAVACRAATAGALAVLLLVCSRANAMASKMFHLERPRWGTQLEYAFRENEQITPTRQSRGVSHQYTEGLTLAGSGYVYHPALLVFDLNFEPKWEQQRQKYEPGEDSSLDSFFLDYGFDATLFQHRSVFLQLRARQNTFTSSSSLSSTTTSESSEYGSTLVYKSKEFPTRFSYLNNEQKQQGFYTSTQAGDSLRLSSSNRRERQQTSLNAEWDKRRRDAQGLSQTTENASLRLSNALDLTADRRIRLSSAVSTRWTENDAMASSNVELNEFLAWQHTDPKKRLQINSSYSARYAANRRDGRLSEDIPLEARLSLSHLLYENLRSSLDGNVGHNKFAGGSEQAYGGRVNFDYTRPVPMGSIFLNLGQGYQVTDRTVTAEFVEVPRLAPEPLSFGLFGARLANRNVDLMTIELFRADGFTYDRKDYDIVEAGAFVEIRPVFLSPLAGDIGNGKRVSASYSYRSDPSARQGTLSRTFGAGFFFWSALNLRYQLTLSEGKLLGGTPPDQLADDTVQNVTAQLRYRWSDTQFSYDDEKRAFGNSSRRWQVRQNFTWRPWRDLSLAVGGSYGESELLDTGSSGTSYGLDASGQWQPLPNQQWRLQAFQRINTSNRPDRNESVGLGLSYLRRLGLWKLEVNYRHIMDQQPLIGQERSLDTLNMVLRRDLF